MSILQRLLPQHALTNFAGLLANCRISWLKNYLIRDFLSRYAVNLAEALEPDPTQYPNFNAFFTRALAPGMRPIASGSHDIISPADGTISQIGDITQDRILQAKGHTYTCLELLGNHADLAEPFRTGSFLTVYLAPKDYHRVHIPLDGHLTHMLYIPGSLFSVNPKTAESVDSLFARNERVVACFNTAIGRVAVILVGAMIVGSIETVWAGTVAPPRRKSVQRWNYDHPIFLKRGDELGRFKLGSTVIVLLEGKTTTWEPGLEATHPIKMGQKIGIFTPDRL